MSFTRQNKDLEVRFVEIDEESADQRLDNFLLRELKKVPKSHIYRIVRSGEVRVNKGRKRPDYRLQAGDTVRIPPVKGVAAVQAPKTGKMGWLLDAVIYEDEQIMALNKPAGLAVHGGSGLNFGIIEVLRKLRPELKFLELVHRLDRDTSGVLLLAKKRSALRALHESLRGTGFIKHYTALVQGCLDSKTVDITEPLLKITKSGEHVMVVDEQGKPSRSYVTKKQEFLPAGDRGMPACLVDIRLFTGRTHQARVHLASIGHPIAGDEKYGNREFNSFAKEAGLKRLFLHASWLQFPHPATNKNLKLAAPLPEDLQNVLDKLK